VTAIVSFLNRYRDVRNDKITVQYSGYKRSIFFHIKNTIQVIFFQYSKQLSFLFQIESIKKEKQKVKFLSDTKFDKIKATILTYSAFITLHMANRLIKPSFDYSKPKKRPAHINPNQKPPPTNPCSLQPLIEKSPSTTAS